jgi:hypothetical protein
MSFRSFLSLAAAIASAASAATDSLSWNHIGYERLGPKTVVVRNSGGNVSTTTFQVVGMDGTVVYEGTASAQTQVPGWGTTRWKVLDFSSVTVPGSYVLRAGSLSTDTFAIGDGVLLRQAGPAVVSFFNTMRSTDVGDRKIAYWNQPQRGTHDVYGGWKDATGDDGKYLSHLSYADFMNPQQIPMVVWSLLRTAELAPSASASFSTQLKSEAAWGADYLLRVLDTQGYFYINVFRDGWSAANPKTICAWIGDSAAQGKSTSDYQAAWREGGGLSIAALAIAARAGISGDSSSARYLAGAVRAFDTLSARKGRWDDDGRENLLDHYCALLAAVELYRATGVQKYLDAAGNRADSIAARQTDDGWFVSDNTTRPFFHGVDEGLPLIALWAYLEIDPSSAHADLARSTLSRSVAWYHVLAREVSNPFVYPRMYAPDGPVGAAVGGSSDIALGAKAWASESEGSYAASNAVDGSTTTRWSAYHAGLPSALDGYQATLSIDLGKTYNLAQTTLTWESAYATQFDILVGADTTNWTTAIQVASGTGGTQNLSFPDGTTGRYLRLRCLKRALQYGGYSVYEWTVAGTAPADTHKVVVPSTRRFFMPHRNETGYWWQGENARLGSLSAAFLLAGRAIAPSWTLDPLDTLSQEGLAGLDWVSGKNSASVNFVYGVGGGDYPAYNGGENVRGGICNGITANSDTDPSPVYFQNTGLTGQPYVYWRWLEQWLPHDANYLLAAAAAAHLAEVPPDVAVSPRSDRPVRMGLRMRAGTVVASLPIVADWTLCEPSGRVVRRVRGAESVEFAPGRGTWLLHAAGPDGFRQTRTVLVP